jgi:ATP phosphoribosyltransferase
VLPLLEGRLQKQTLELLAGSDIRFSKEARYDIALVKNHHAALIFLPAVDIPKHVALGGADLGITGLDQLAEYEADVAPTPETELEHVLALNFGGCKLQVQVPNAGPISQVQDLIGKTVATSFKCLTTKYFQRIEKEHGAPTAEGDASADRELQTKILHINGSVESACIVGLAQGVVDLVGEISRVCENGDGG